MLARDRKLRGPLSLLAFAWLAVASAGPMGCGEPPVPPMPQLPKLEAPAVDLPKPPEPQAPTAPKAPAMPQGGGNCCLRGGPVAKDKCGGSETCCVKDFEDSDDCEAHKGFWFFSKDGCAGAC